MKKIQAVFTAIGATLSSILGVLYIPTLMMVACNVIDYLTGMIAAHERGERITSGKGLSGIIKKVCLWLLVVVGSIVDSMITYATEQAGLNFRMSFLVACVVVIWIICNEVISILENMSDIGVPMPKFLMKIVVYIQAQTEAKVVVPEKDEKAEGE